MRRWLAILSLALAHATLAFADDLPSDVADFIAERQQCDHFRGEDASDPARHAEITAALERYCRGTDARLAALKAKYRNGPSSAQDALAVFDDHIE